MSKRCSSPRTLGGRHCVCGLVGLGLASEGSRLDCVAFLAAKRRAPVVLLSLAWGGNRHVGRRGSPVWDLLPRGRAWIVPESTRRASRTPDTSSNGGLVSVYFSLSSFLLYLSLFYVIRAEFQVAPRRRGSAKRDLELGLGIRYRARIRGAGSGRGRGKHLLFFVAHYFRRFIFLYHISFPFILHGCGTQCTTLHASALMAPVSEISATNKRYGASAAVRRLRVSRWLRRLLPRRCL